MSDLLYHEQFIFTDEESHLYLHVVFISLPNGKQAREYFGEILPLFQNSTVIAAGVGGSCLDIFPLVFYSQLSGIWPDIERNTVSVAF